MQRLARAALARAVVRQRRVRGIVSCPSAAEAEQLRLFLQKRREELEKSVAAGKALKAEAKAARAAKAQQQDEASEYGLYRKAVPEGGTVLGEAEWREQQAVHQTEQAAKRQRVDAEAQQRAEVQRGTKRKAPKQPVAVRTTHLLRLLHPGTSRGGGPALWPIPHSCHTVQPLVAN